MLPHLYTGSVHRIPTPGDEYSYNWVAPWTGTTLTWADFAPTDGNVSVPSEGVSVRDRFSDPIRFLNSVDVCGRDEIIFC